MGMEQAGHQALSCNNLVNVMQNAHSIHPIACLSWQDMGCLL